MDKHTGRRPYKDEDRDLAMLLQAKETSFYKPRKPEIVSKPSKLGQKNGTDSPSQPQKDAPALISGLQSCEKVNFHF